MNEPTMIHVASPGLMTTVQDLGRVGRARYGVAPGGALDRGALILGNRLLGNAPGDAALEITLIGPTLRFDGGAIIAVTGADLGARLSGGAVPLWTPVDVGPGDELRFDPSMLQTGARAYLCVAGGIDVESVLGSRSTDLIGQFGGWHGRPLAAGDELPVGRPNLAENEILARRLSAPLPRRAGDAAARVVRGPQWDRFSDEGIAAFLGDGFTVTPRSNRQGIRLSGPPILQTRGADIVSEGIAHGAVQVPGDGQPIVLLAARQTVGGYVKIATVAGADMDLLGQLRPGGQVRFVETSVSDARAALLGYRASLGPDAVASEPRMHGGSNVVPVSVTEEIERVQGAWDPDGVIRVIAALEAAGATSFSIEDASAGFRLELRRGERGPANAHPAIRPEREGSACAADDAVITAPVLGVFYRRSAPNQPPLAEPGQRVERGQVVCVIEVMKSYHEVTASTAGVLAEFLVEDGQFVEYGQPIARLA